MSEQQVKACNESISLLTQEVEALASSLREKENMVAQLERKLQSHQQEASTPEQLLELPYPQDDSWVVDQAIVD